ncbi:hypothetical protein Tco_1508615 [Tanacetum coccineum]
MNSQIEAKVADKVFCIVFRAITLLFRYHYLRKGPADRAGGEAITIIRSEKRTWLSTTIVLTEYGRIPRYGHSGSPPEDDSHTILARAGEASTRNLLDAVPTSETLLDAGVRSPTRREFNEEEQRLNLDLQQERREAAAIREARYKSKMEQYYNKKVRLAGFRPGEFVYRRNEASRVGIKGSWVPSGKAHTRYDELKNGSFNVANGWGQDSSGLALRLNLRKSRTPNFNGESNFPMNDCYNLGYGKSNRTTKSTGP